MPKGYLERVITARLVFVSLVFLLVFVPFSHAIPDVLFVQKERQSSEAIELQTCQVLDFKKYHTSGEVVDMLQTFQISYPKLIRVYSIGDSFEGKPIWAAEITNSLTGSHETKPAMLFIGPHHGNEIIGQEIALYYTWYVLTNYGVNEKVTQILDEKTIYIIPCVNVDGNDLTLKGFYQRNNARPRDEDLDGQLDEDPCEDLNGDGKITQMRVWNETTNQWISYPEGIDNDGDGLYNEDGIGGVDLNRNYPKAWTNFSNSDHGAYPLSEPETTAVKNFVESSTNIAVVFDTHSGAQCLLHPWAYSRVFQTPDNSVYIALRERYENLTGYEYRYVGANGACDDWIYDTQNALCFIVELFGPMFYPGGESQFQKDYPDVFVPWQNFTHPQLGCTQIGGSWIFRKYNPPEAEIEKWALKVLPMLIDLVEITPKLEIAHFGVSKMMSGMFNFSVAVANIGFFDTATLQALQTSTNKPVNISVLLSFNIELVGGNQTVALSVIKNNETVGTHWQIRIKQDGYAWVKVRVSSSNGGVDEVTVRFSVPERERLHIIP